jgi:microsomal dipeptidase-like Zn-dependent dipeptidase
MSVVGYADLHCHPMAHLAFGGIQDGRALFWGRPTDAVDQALPCCTAAHDVWKGGGILPRFTEHEGPAFDGFDSFVSWPRPTTVIHQQMYVDGVKRAFRGGLRLMVASAVNNELLADMYHRRGVDSTDDAAITAQLAGMRALAEREADWMAIVTSAAEARAVMESGRLAVVLGIEVDSIAGGPMRREGQLDPARAAEVVETWWQRGVRSIIPVHLTDNALGGTAIFDDRFNLSNHYLHSKWASDLPEPWFYDAEAAGDVEFLLGGNRDNDILIQLYGKGYPSYVKRLGASGHVNRRGLSEAGEAFVSAMMDRGMLIDVEHMSSHCFDATLALAQGRNYPLISSHTSLRALAVPRPAGSLHVRGGAAESMRTDAQLQALAALGSVIGLGGHIGVIKDLNVDSSLGWARAYRHARELIGLDAIAIGTDMNGLAAAPGPRFARDAQGALRPIALGDATRPIDYGADLVPIVQQALEQTALGRRRYDYNTDGLAHYGLLPDFTLDVALSIGAPESLRAFFNSAEALVTAWQRCEA